MTARKAELPETTMVSNELNVQSESQALVEATPIYLFRGIPYVPHFRIFDVYVAPGNRLVSGKELRAFKNVQVKAWMLWPRPKEKAIRQELNHR